MVKALPTAAGELNPLLSRFSTRGDRASLTAQPSASSTGRSRSTRLGKVATREDMCNFQPCAGRVTAQPVGQSIVLSDGAFDTVFKISEIGIGHAERPRNVRCTSNDYCVCECVAISACVWLMQQPVHRVRPCSA